MPFAPFQLGRFLCVHELSVGSTAAVYVARYHGVEGFEKLVVVKRVHDHVAKDPEFVSRFVADARLGAALSHGGIVRVLECAAVGPSYLMASEFVDGISVKQLLTSLDRRGGRLPAEAAAAFVMGVADALDYAHRFTGLGGEGGGVIHGGLRPSKILLPRGRGVKVLDFGVAEAFAYARRSAPSLDWADYAYLAPEVVEAGHLSAASDLFALGAILYELTTCEPLFLRADAGATLQAVAAPRVPRHPALPDALHALVLSCVARDPGERVGSAADVYDALARWLASRRLTPSAAEATASLEDVFSDWALRLPSASATRPTAELQARRKAPTAPHGHRAYDPAGSGRDASSEDDDSEDPWDPLFALHDALGRGRSSHITGLSAVVEELEPPPTRPVLPRVSDDDTETVERRFARSLPPGSLPSLDWLEHGTGTGEPSVDPAGDFSAEGSWPTEPDPDAWLDGPSDPGGEGWGEPTRRGGSLPGGPAAAAAPPLPPTTPAAPAPAPGPGPAPAGPGRLTDLAAGLEALASRRPHDLAVRTHLAGVYRLQGRVEDAEGIIGGVLADAPRFAPAWYQLGLVRHQTGQAGEADWAFRQALEAEPSHGEARMALAVLRLAEGDLDEAVAELTAVVAANWRSGRAHRLLARCFLRSGDRTAALEHCDYAASFGEEVADLRQEILGRN